MTTLVFLIGFLLVSYGLFLAFAESVSVAALWILLGVAIQLASGDAWSGGRGGRRLKNPIDVLSRGLRDVRAKVQGWEHRP